MAVSRLIFRIWSRFDESWGQRVKQFVKKCKFLIFRSDVPDTGLLCDLLWADPEKEVSGWAENDRGVSFTFGQDIVNKFLNKHDLGEIVFSNFQEIFWLQNFRSYLSRPSSRRGWLRVFCETTIGHAFLGTKLLWRVWQCWWHDVGGWDVNVLLSNSQAVR